ncbi:GNAT family N-acetyltransferase [Natrononativus amylolyticus]|uniref:GNAT family N-acetyltransferase n=1 Tax=Natrononativus amylolyticus TaxID=2963434 RepID=UPI0020CF7BF3|nr:GNAT family N-acetyltransferase [Natrononativus amylolyticus]
MATDHSRTTDATTAPSERASTDRTPPDPYEIRLYEPADREGFLELYDLVLGDRDDDWFRWKYEENPYADHVPIVLATHDDEVVGTKPCFALELRVGDRTVRGFQPADVMVHPDHRRRGLYSRTTERMKEYYRDRDPSLFFNFPNQATLSGSLKHGWQIVEEVPTFYRIQNPDGLVDTDDGRLAALSNVAQPLVSGYLRAREATVRPRSDITVARFDDVPATVLADLYRRAVPSTLHAHRDRTFYGWRFENPRWQYRTYVATRYGEPIAAVVTGTTTQDGSVVTSLADVVPLEATPDRDDGLRSILARVLEDNRGADILAASGRTIPPALLGRFGFHSDQSLPLSRLTIPTTQVTYPIANEDGHGWTIAGRAVTDPANWTVTFAEQDTW